MKTAFTLVLAFAAQAAAQGVPERFPQDRIVLRAATDRASRTPVLTGTLRVAENRATGQGRHIDLHVVVLPARSKTPKPDPIFPLAGGPGQGAASVLIGSWANSPLREHRDIVLVDQRGTGRSNPLRVERGNAENLQSYLEPLFDPEAFAAARQQLEQRADLRWYTTPVAADDLDDVRRALGYEKINVTGGSYGTRMALIYMRRHENHVRTAVLDGVAPIAFKNPLYHAAAAQRCLDLICDEVESHQPYRDAFGDLRAKLGDIYARLDRENVVTSVRTADGETHEITLDREAFSGALRVMMYYGAGNRSVPMVIDQASRGDFSAFAREALRVNIGLRNSLALGMLMSVVGSEDIPRITEDEIRSVTAETFVGDARVRAQMAVAEIWPRGQVPDSYGEPVAVDTPTLVLSGTHDAVTPPEWGEEAARHLPNARHIVVPGFHGVGRGKCLQSVILQFVELGSVAGLDLDCVESIQLPKLRV